MKLITKMYSEDSLKFSIIGPSGYIAARHLKAISEFTSAGIFSFLDISNQDFHGRTERTKFFDDEEKFFLNILENKVDYVVICSPNNLHYSHIQQSIEAGAKVICEKPLVFLRAHIEELKSEQYRNKIFGIMQMRLHPVVKKIRSISNESNRGILKFVTKRDEAYKKSWKVKREYSGGILFNLGIHYFDLLFQIFGNPKDIEVEDLSDFRSSGVLTFENLQLQWLLSIDDKDLPHGTTTLREFSLGKYKIDFSSVDKDLHIQNYEKIINEQQFEFRDIIESHKIISDIYEK